MAGRTKGYTQHKAYAQTKWLWLRVYEHDKLSSKQPHLTHEAMYIFFLSMLLWVNSESLNFEQEDLDSLFMANLMEEGNNWIFMWPYCGACKDLPG